MLKSMKIYQTNASLSETMLKKSELTDMDFNMTLF